MLGGVEVGLENLVKLRVCVRQDTQGGLDSATVGQQVKQEQKVLSVLVQPLVILVARDQGVLRRSQLLQEQRESRDHGCIIYR